MSFISNVTIYGERCSGTNYLENLLNINFDIDITWKYGHKHFFGFQDELLKNSDETIFICIVRNPVDWVNSLYRNPHHLCDENCSSIENFLTKRIISYQFNSKTFQNEKSDNQGKEILEDRNIYTGERYKNIFELRHTKLQWMIEDLPNKVKNYIFIRHEDLINDFDNTMFKIKNKGLKIKDTIEFPLNTNKYKGTNQVYVKKKNTIPDDLIVKNPNLIPFYEKKLYNI